MSFFYFFISSWPFWAIPLGLIFLEQANRTRIRKEYRKGATFVLFAVLLFVTSGIFIYLGGYKNLSSLTDSVENRNRSR